MTMKRGLSAGALFLGVLSAGGAAQATTFLFTGTVQTFDVTTTGVYDITAYGAQGGGGFPMVGAGGLGAEIGGDVTLTAGSILSFLIGGSGAPGGPPGRIFGVGGGGGGTFVVLNGTAPTLLAVAGGGGGGNFSSPGGSGLALASGDGGGLGGTGGDDHAGGGGGVGGSGETGEDVGSAALGGAGFNDGIALGGPSELSGGDGGGGGNFGGGGGYCGGDGGDLGGGGGGCSFLDSIVTEDVSLPGENINDGFVTISAGSTVPEPSTWAMMLLGFAGLSVVGFRAQRKTAAAAIN